MSRLAVLLFGAVIALLLVPPPGWLGSSLGVGAIGTSTVGPVAPHPATPSVVPPLAPGATPHSRYAASMAFDAKDGYLVLFGGVVKVNAQFVPTQLTNSTWKFDHGAWVRLHPAQAPPARWGASMAYDVRDGYVVLFGGVGSGYPGSLGDTWIFSHGNWSQLSPGTSPPSRMRASMSYDVRLGAVVLFGGATSAFGGYLHDTWRYSAGNWSLLSPARSPPARYGASMKYDTADHFLMLFGGYAVSKGRAVVYNDTWKYVAGNWTRIHPAASPPGGDGASLVYDAQDGYMLLFGGSAGSGKPWTNVTWSFSAGVWTNLTAPAAPPSRMNACMANDAPLGYVVLFGGADLPQFFNDTWSFHAGNWTQL